MRSLSHAIHAILLIADPQDKIMATRALVRDWRAGHLAFQFKAAMPDYPARPDKPILLPPGQMPRRRGGSQATRIALWHSLAHIEYVAIDLALDIVGRFAAKIAEEIGPETGKEFASDFLSVAADEAMHFALLMRKLRTLGSSYGALPAHDGLWQAAGDTAHDVAARLAIVPMVLEARGLDVTPATIERVAAQGDDNGVKILIRILDDEIRHVRFGSKYFNLVCKARNQSPESEWKTLVNRHFMGRVKPPFNDSARSTTGLPRNFYAPLAE